MFSPWKKGTHTHSHVYSSAARSCLFRAALPCHMLARWMQLPLSLSCHAAWILCPLPCFSGMQTLFEWIATWTSLAWKHKHKPAGWTKWRELEILCCKHQHASANDDFSTWRSLWEAEKLTQNWTFGKSHGSMIYCSCHCSCHCLCQSAKHLCEVRWTLPIDVNLRK